MHLQLLQLLHLLNVGKRKKFVSPSFRHWVIDLSIWTPHSGQRLHGGGRPQLAKRFYCMKAKE